jgi:hypothetical protein
MAGMDHGNMPGMQHGAPEHTAMSGMNHANMPGMQHGGTEARPAPPQTTNSAIAQTSPSSTLAADEFDRPAATAVSEAEKSARNAAVPGTP